MNRSSMTSVRRFVLLLSGLTLLVGCTEPAPPTASTVNHRTVLAHGEQLYAKHCASCHGERAQGAANWHKPGPDGKFPAPPLDASGHAWHHPQRDLVAAVKFGTLSRGGSMPAWKETFSDADIDAILAWLQSRWPPEIYAQWQKIDQSVQADRRN